MVKFFLAFLSKVHEYCMLQLNCMLCVITNCHNSFNGSKVVGSIAIATMERHSWAGLATGWMVVRQASPYDWVKQDMNKICRCAE